MLRYVLDAPLANVSDELLGIELLGTSTLDERSTAHMALLERVSADFEKTRKTSLLGPYVLKVSDRRGKLHRVQRGSSAFPPWEWSTTCGVRFGFWAFTLHPSSTSFPFGYPMFREASTTSARSPSLSTAPLSPCSSSCSSSSPS